MSMDRVFSAFADEMTKIAISVGISPFNQTRRGRRPIRVHTLLKNHSIADSPDTASEERDRPPQDAIEYEGGPGLSEGPMSI